MLLIAIDPHVKKSAIAVWENGKIYDLFEISTDFMINNPSGISLSMSSLIKENKNKVAVIESQYLGSDKKTGKQFIESTIKLAQTAGMIAGSLIRSGFKIAWAPPWGNNGWIACMLSQNGRCPKSNQISKISKDIAKDLYPGWKINEHSAAAICMAHWYMKKQKMEALAK